MRARLVPLALFVGLFASAGPAAASHYVNERVRDGVLTEREARVEVRRILRQRGFARAVTTGLHQACNRRSALRMRCRYSRTLSGGTFLLLGSADVYVASRSRGELLRYRLNTTVSISAPCEGSAAKPCVSRFHFTHLNHQRVSSGG